MSDLRAAPRTLTYRVAAALRTVPSVSGDTATRRIAMAYAEAIDDDDEGDALFRFGPRLQTALEALGLGHGAHDLLRAGPSGAVRLAEPRRGLTLVPPLSPYDAVGGTWARPPASSAA